MQSKQSTTYNGASNRNATKISLRMLTATILVAIIAIIFYIYIFQPVDWPIFRNLANTTSLISGQLAELNIFQPVDWPIFRNLANTTSLISGQLAELNIPASAVIMEYRVTSQYLAKIIERNKLSPNNSDNIAQYLNQLGEKLSNSGKAIEKMYPVGNLALKEVGRELKFIINNIRPGQILTKQNVTYFVDCYGNILNTVTELRDNFQKIIVELDELYILYNGTHHQLVNGINDVELFFEKITPELEEYYDMEKLKRDLGYLRQMMKKVPDIRYQIHRLLYEFNNHRQILIWYRSEWLKFWRQKVVSFEDTEQLEEVIPIVNNMAEIFIKKNRENIEKRIYV